MRVLAIFILLFFGLSFAANAKPQPNTNTRRASYKGRNYEIVFPNSDRTAPRPTVFILHGGGGTGKKLRQHFDFSPLAKKADVVLVYPDGKNGHWNDGRAGGRKLFRGTAPDDVGYLTGLAKHLYASGISQEGEFYLVGVSNGGMMVGRLMCQAPHMFKAGVTIIAGLPANLKNCQPTHARPVLMIGGDLDPIMPWGGGGVGFRKDRGLVLSGADSFAHWRAINQCQPGTTTPLPNTYILDKTKAVLHTSLCESNNHVEMIVIKNGGHNIPMPVGYGPKPKSRRYKRRVKLLGRYNHDFDSRKRIWQFFERAGL